MLGKERRQALLVLEDGTVYRGVAFAGQGEVLGEVVFNTGMSGYQEVLTDPSYKGQIVAMTYPLIGNTGINPEDMESDAIHLEGFVVREYQDYASNWRSRQDLKSFLESQGKLGVEGIDTRALTRRIRITGAMRGILSTETADIETLLHRVQGYPGLVGRDLVKEVSCRAPYRWKDGTPCEWGEEIQDPRSDPAARRRVVVLDCGVKFNILRNLEKRGCEVLVLPAAATGEEILALRPDGVLLSNGPGDPAALPYIVEAVAGDPGKGPPLRHLPGSSGPGSGGRRPDGETQVRPSRDQSAHKELPERPGRNHFPEPRVRGPARIPLGGEGDGPRKSQRPHLGGDLLPGPQGLQCPVPPGGGPGSARLGLSVRRVHPGYRSKG